MKGTGIIRRVDDLGKIVIPKEIRRTIGIEEDTPMEFFVDKDCICLKKYNADEETFAFECHKYITSMSEYIKGINFLDGTTVVLFTNGKIATLRKRNDDAFDMNIALCHACAQVGYVSENPVCK